MISFESDYVAGAHPEILRRLSETNFEHLPGYGRDRYCESAKAKIREATGRNVDVEFLVGIKQPFPVFHVLAALHVGNGVLQFVFIVVVYEITV